MATRPKNRFWRICRICFRRLRITIWVLILALLGSLIYINQIGLPGIVKRPLLQKLRERGIELQFSRLRVRWQQGIVAENVRFGGANEPLSPRVTASDVQVELNQEALKHFQLQVDSLLVRKGRLVVPVESTNGQPRFLIIEDIRTDLRLLPNDEWSLDHFTAQFAGAKIQLSGAVTNASKVREWKFWQGQEPARPGSGQHRLRQLADLLEKLHFSAPPELRVGVRGDGRDPQSFYIRIVCNAAGAETPWGTIQEGKLTARLVPAETNGISRAELTLETAQAQTDWGATTDLKLDLHASISPEETNLVNATLTLSAAVLATRWGGATNAHVGAEWTHSLTNPIPISGKWLLEADHAENPEWGSAGSIRLSANFADSDSKDAGHADASWAFWAKLEPYAAKWQCHLRNLRSPRLDATEITCDGEWHPPVLTITNLHAGLYNGVIQSQGSVDVATRKVEAALSSNLDPQRIYHLLTDGARQWLADYKWEGAPDLKAEVTAILPAWTNREPDWRKEVLPSLNLNGQFSITNECAYRGIPLTSARSHFIYSNMIWRLPDLKVTRSEGEALVIHEADDRTRQFYFKVTSTLDPMIVRPLVETNVQKVLDLFSLTQPPALEAEIRGTWHSPDQIGMNARVALTNFTFRGEKVDGVQSSLAYTNRLLTAIDPKLQRGAERLGADGLAFDFVSERIFLTNGTSTGDPQVVARVIGDNVAQVIAPYRFSKPPTARVHGIIPTRNEKDADLYFDLEGGSFHWWKFNLPYISGQIHWKGDHLTLTGINAQFYGGKATGAASFDFSVPHGADYRFTVTATNTVLQALMRDLTARTNNPEGMLSGTLVITNANTESPKILGGYGRLDLRDGLIWAIPVFGVFSPALDGLVSGLGSSRATAATANFGITNAVVRSPDLEIRAPAMRLNYRGTVDLDGNLNAKVEAELLRDMPVLGPIVSTMLWPVTKMFEYKVGGSLAQPKVEPLYFIPKIVLIPFHPFRTIRELFEESGSVLTNSPPPLERTP